MKKTPPPLNLTRARRIRREPTLAEQAMWRLLRANFQDQRFRRQVPLANAIADFASHRARLVIEVDGGQHDAAADAGRDRSIEREGYRVVRFWNNEVLGNPDGCVSRIGQALRSHPHPTSARQQAGKPAYPPPIQGEEDFIASLRTLATHPAARGLADDCAVLEIGGEALVLTHDMMAEGVHWLPGQDMADVAWKLVAVNLSDLAAKGAEPLGVLLGYMLGGEDARFVAGLEEALRAFGVPLLGGDTVSGGPPRSFGLTAIGRATHRPAPSRAGARAGDGLWIAGTVGAAMLGFEALRDGTGEDSEAYRRPRPLLAEGRALAPHVTAMIDVSDGLLLDASRIAEASGVTIAIDAASVPIAASEHRRAAALRWGDDYALLFTAPPSFAPPVNVQRIGEVRQREDHPLLIDGAAPAADDKLGYQHTPNAAAR